MQEEILNSQKQTESEYWNPINKAIEEIFAIYKSNNLSYIQIHSLQSKIINDLPNHLKFNY